MDQHSTPMRTSMTAHLDERRPDVAAGGADPAVADRGLSGSSFHSLNSLRGRLELMRASEPELPPIFSATMELRWTLLPAAIVDALHKKFAA